MNAELTELVFILDRSGSMGGLESDTISGFNGMIARQKTEGKQVNVTTVLFDDEVEIIHDRFPIEIVRRHIVGGANRTLISVKTPLRLCRTGTCRKLSAERPQIVVALFEKQLVLLLK